MIEAIYKELKEFAEIGYAKYNLEKANEKAKELLAKRKNKASVTNEQYSYALYVQGLWELKQNQQDLAKTSQGPVLSKMFEAANKGLLEAQYRLAYLLYTTGLLEPVLNFKQQSKIAEYLKTATEAWEKAPHDANALFHLGKIYAHGVGVEPDPQKAYDYYTKAIALNHPLAMNNLAWAIKSGFIPENLYAPHEKYDFSFNLFKTSDEMGNLFASFNLGVHYLRELDTEENLKKAISYFEKTQPLWDDLMGPLTVHSVEGYFAIGYYNYVQATSKVASEEQIKKLEEAKKFFSCAVKLYESLEEDKKEESKKACGNANLFLGVIHEFSLNDPAEALPYYKNAESQGNETAKELCYSLKTEHKKLLNPHKKPGYSRLHSCAEQDKADEIKKLLGNPFLRLEVDQKSSSGQTPLHFASKSKKLKAIDALLYAKADVDARDFFDNTPLHVAADNGHVTVLEILQRVKADPKIHNKGGNLPLHVASQNGHTKAITFLLNINAYKNIEEDMGLKNALALAFKNGNNLTPFEEFVDKKTKQTLLHFATERNEPKFMKLLKKLGIYAKLLNKRDGMGNAPIHTASLKNNKEFVADFIEEGAIIDEVKSPTNAMVNLTAATPKDILAEYPDLRFHSITDVLGVISDPGRHGDKYSEIIAYLLKKTPNFNPPDIIQKIRECAEALDAIKDPIEKSKIIKAFVNPLVHADLEKIEEEIGDLKYLAQWYQDAGQVKSPGYKPHALERWRPEDFLAINIKLLFTSLVEKLGELDQESFDIFAQELCLELDTLRARRDFLAIQNQTRPVQQAYFEAQADKILKLKEGESCVFNQGHLEHSIYISFTREKNQILVRIDNLDDFEHEDFSHAHSEEDNDLLYPYVALLPSEPEDKARIALKKYFERICNARSKKKEEAISKIYNLKKQGFTILTRDEIIDRNILGRKKQLVNNCVVENFKGGLESRMESKVPGLYTILRNNLVSTDAQFHAAQRDRSYPGKAKSLGINESAQKLAALTSPRATLLSPRESSSHSPKEKVEKKMGDVKEETASTSMHYSDEIEIDFNANGHVVPAPESATIAEAASSAISWIGRGASSVSNAVSRSWSNGFNFFKSEPLPSNRETKSLPEIPKPQEPPPEKKDGMARKA